MHNFLVEMCRSCLKQDVPLFDTMDSQANLKRVKHSTVIQNLFRKDIIEEYNWKLCEDCTVLLKGAVLLEKGLLSSKLVYNNYLRMFDTDNHVSSNTFSNLSVEIKDIQATSEKHDIVEVRHATVEDLTAHIIDPCMKTEFQSDVESLEDDAIETKIKIEIDETNYENLLNDFHYVKVNIKTDTENDGVIDPKEENIEVEPLSNAASSQRRYEHPNVGTKMNAGPDYNHDNVRKCTKKESFVQHFRTHRVVKSHKCDFCTKSFSRKSDFNVHRRIHMAEKPFKCDLCTKAFSYNSDYSRHRLIHTGEKPYKCDLCTKQFSQKSHYDLHRRIHTGEKPFKCDLCIKAFSYNSDYRRHRLIHTGEKPYKCDLCTKQFSQKSYYDLHRRIHTGEKPYKCDLCTKAFSQKSSYDVHRRIHTGEKPYKCDLCTKAFSNNSAYNRHSRIHTDGNTYI